MLFSGVNKTRLRFIDGSLSVPVVVLVLYLSGLDKCKIEETGDIYNIRLVL